MKTPARSRLRWRAAGTFDRARDGTLWVSWRNAAHGTGPPVTTNSGNVDLIVG